MWKPRGQWPPRWIDPRLHARVMNEEERSERRSIKHTLPTHSATMSDDPTADFLAREKALLGDNLFDEGEITGLSSGAGESHGMSAFPDLDDGRSSCWIDTKRCLVVLLLTLHYSPSVTFTLRAARCCIFLPSSPAAPTSSQIPRPTHHAPMESLVVAGLALTLPSPGQVRKPRHGCFACQVGVPYQVA